MHGRGDRMAPKAPMILATGKQIHPSPDVKGFTLIEIVMVLGLMAFAAAVVITNFASMADRGDSQTSEEILQAAVREARFIAATKRMVTELRFDKETGSLLISGGAAEGEPFKLDENFSKSGPAEIVFYLVPPSEGLSPPPDGSWRTSRPTRVAASGLLLSFSFSYSSWCRWF